MQVCHLVCHLPGTSCTPHASFPIAPHAPGFTLTYGQDFNTVQALVCITIPLQRPTCPLLDHTPSIEEGTGDDVDLLGNVELSLFCSQYYPQLVPPRVEVCLSNIS